MKRFLRKISKKSIRVFLALLMLLSYFTPAIKVFAQDYNTEAGDKVLSIDVDNHQSEDFQFISAKVNNNTWTDNQDRYFTDDDIYEITISVKTLGEKTPNIMYGGNWNGYFTANNVAIADDIYTFDFTLDKSSYPATQEDPGTFCAFFIEELNNNSGYHPEFDSTGYVNLTIIGPKLETNYDGYASEIKVGINNDSHNFYGIDPATAQFIPTPTSLEEFSSISTTEPIVVSYPSDSNHPDKVVISIKAQWNSLLTNVVINNVSYASDLPNDKEGLIAIYNNQQLEYYFEVDKEDDNTYDVVVYGRKQLGNEIIMGNFLWNYDPNSNATADDDKIPNAKLEFVKAVVGNTTYTNIEDFNAAGNIYTWRDAVRKDVYTEFDSSMGEATLPVGTELTVKLIPDPGYQLTSFGLNGNPFEPGNEPCVYTFTITGGNFHLEAKFTEEGNEVKSSVDTIQNGNIKLNGDAFEYGTAKLEVGDASNISANRIAEFDNKAEEAGYNVTDYLDLSLFNTVYKGGLKDNNGNYESWDTSITNLNNDADITLQLKDNMAGKDLVIVHELHEGANVTGYEIIDATYNDENNTVTFKTDSFSNYAIAVKDSSNKDYTVTKDGSSISFTKPEGHNYTLTITDWMSLSEQELIDMGAPLDEVRAGINAIKELTKEYGTLVGIYDFVLEDEAGNEIHNGPFTIKIKMTDDMKAYNEFYIVYVKDDLSTETPIKLTVEDGYLVGTLDHLSNYAITAKKVENKTPVSDTTTTNPKTADHLGTYVGILVVSSISLIGATVYLKKKLTN